MQAVYEGGKQMSEYEKRILKDCWRWLVIVSAVVVCANAAIRLLGI